MRSRRIHVASSQLSEVHNKRWQCVCVPGGGGEGGGGGETIYLHPLLVSGALGDSGKVVGGQQVHVGDARRLELS